MDLHEFNIRVLNSIGIIDETGKGHLSRVIGEGTSPFTINGKRVVLPTSEHLRSNGEGTIIYHPLSENITRAESDMIKSLRDSIMYKLTLTSVTLISELGRVAATPSEHKRLDPASGKYLKQLSEMDERTYEFLQKVILRIAPEPEKRLVSISLRKGQKADGVLRSVKFKFPVLDALLTDEPDLLGVKYPSKKARNTLRALFEIVLGDEETRAAYDYGSKNMVAPYFHALMTGYYNMASHLNDVVKQHKKLLGKEIVESLTIDLTWYEGMETLAEMRRLVPPQEGNEGAIIVSEPKSKDEIAEKVASRIAPANRDRASREKEDEAVDLPWGEEREAARRPAERRPEPQKRGKSLDEFLHGGRRDDDDRRHGFGRRSEDRSSYSFSRDRDSIRERSFGRGSERRYDSGGRDRDRDFGFNRRDERSFGRRSFGNGSGRLGF
jgi:hypothetical protein